MTFDKQVKEAKAKQLQSRITRDVVFIFLGLGFLLVSFLMAYKNDAKNEVKKNIKTTTTIKVNKKN